jgi:transposase
MLAIHPNARTTPAVRAEIARSAEPTGELARRYGVSTETVRKWRKRGATDCRDRSSRPRRLPWKASEEERAVVCALRRATGFPLDDLTFVVAHFLPHLDRDNVYRILKAAGLSRRPAAAAPRREAGTFGEYGLGFVHVDVKHLPKLRTAGGEWRKRFLFVAIDRRSRLVHLAVRDDETEASARAFLGEALAAFPFRVTHVLTDRGAASPPRASRRPAGSTASSTAGPGPTRPGRTAWSSASTGVCNVKCSASRWPATATWSAAGRFSSAYNARRQRVLGGRSPDEVVREGLQQDTSLANPGYRPPSDPCALPKAMLVVERAKDVSQPDTVDTAKTLLVLSGMGWSGGG